MNIISILAYTGIGLDWRKVSGSPPSRRGQSFLPEVLPKEERSFLASFFGVLTKVVSSSSPQLYSSNVSSKSGLASELLKIFKLSLELNRLRSGSSSSFKRYNFHIALKWRDLEIGKAENLQNFDTFKANISHRWVCNHHFSVKNLWANLYQTEDCHPLCICWDQIHMT